MLFQHIVIFIFPISYHSNANIPVYQSALVFCHRININFNCVLFLFCFVWINEQSGHGKGSTVQSPNRKRNSRNKMPSTATPLRHVLSKSILRAIRERAGDTPGSPLDLRLSPVIRRSYSDPVRNRTGNSKIEQLQEHAHCDLPVKSSSIVIEARPTFLATVYESAKNFQQLRSGDYETVAEGYEMAESAPHDEVDIKNMSRVGEQTALKDDAETDKPQQNADGIHGKDDIWYTPNEFPPITYNAEEHEVRRQAKSCYNIRVN